MKIRDGLNEKVFDFNAEYGVLHFIGLRAEPKTQNEDTQEYTEVRKRVYNLLSDTKQRIIQVSLPAEVPLKEFSHMSEIKLINPVLNFMAAYQYPNPVEIVDYLTADDIVMASSVPSAQKKDEKK